MGTKGKSRRRHRQRAGPAGKSRLMLVRTLGVLYWSLLTVLLLAKDPLALLGIRRLPGGVGATGMHFATFAVLGLLVSASRWPLKRAWLWAVLLGYATVVELLQWFTPPRTVELRDWVENLLGLAVGVAAWGIAQQFLPRLLGRDNRQTRPPTGDRSD